MKKFRLLLVAAVAVLVMAACGPTPEELVIQGKVHYDTDNYAEAMACFQKAAEKGNAWAQYNLGMMYFNGDGVTKSTKDAKYWWRKAADQGNDDARKVLNELTNEEKAKQSAKEMARRLSNSKNVYSVSGYKKVKFSLGNLQYQASTDTWRFADHP